MLLGKGSESCVQATANKTYMYMLSVAISMWITYKVESVAISQPRTSAHGYWPLPIWNKLQNMQTPPNK